MKLEMAMMKNMMDSECDDPQARKELMKKPVS